MGYQDNEDQLYFKTELVMNSPPPPNKPVDPREEEQASMYLLKRHPFYNIGSNKITHTAIFYVIYVDEHSKSLQVKERENNIFTFLL